MNITVRRAPADKQGEDIRDELLTSEAVAIARGRREIDSNSTDRQIITCSSPVERYIPTGLLVEVAEESGTWRGVSRYWSCTMIFDENSCSVEVRTEIEREA